MYVSMYSYHGDWVGWQDQNVEVSLGYVYDQIDVGENAKHFTQTCLHWHAPLGDHWDNKKQCWQFKGNNDIV